MKLTWFGGTTIRIHIGGLILVVDPAGAPQGVDHAELVSGADRVVDVKDGSLPEVELTGWRPRRAVRPLDDAGDIPDAVVAKSGGSILVDAQGERPLVLMLEGALPPLARWADGAVFVLLGDPAEMASVGTMLLENYQPRAVAVAGSEDDLDRIMPVLAPLADGTSIVSLEAGLALEI